MEQYSEALRQALEKDLHGASAPYLIDLGRYFRHRRGPGFELVKAELRRRHQQKDTAKRYTPSPL